MAEEILNVNYNKILEPLIQRVILVVCRRAKLGQIQGGCRGPAKIRQRRGCNNFLLFTR